MSRVHNFSGGPAALPLPVLERAQSELLDWRGQGASVMEISHRGQPFMDLRDEVEQDLRDLLNISDDYAVLFLGSSARAQFSMIPLNMLGDHEYVDGLASGFWSQLALTEMQHYTKVNIVANAETTAYRSIPEQASWQLSDNPAYFYYTANETLSGLAFDDIPTLDNIPLVCDMTSCLLAENLDITRFGLIFAGAQKNLGIAGLSIVIVRRDLIQQPASITPLAFNYQRQDQCHSLLVTPPTFAIYISGLVFKWIKQQGGLNAMQQINHAKAASLYRIIDTYPNLYQNQVATPYRSNMNVTFQLPNDNMLQQFLTKAERHKLQGLKGHCVQGGIRASIYNGVSAESVNALADFMQAFAEQQTEHK